VADASVEVLAGANVAEQAIDLARTLSNVSRQHSVLSSVAAISARPASSAGSRSIASVRIGATRSKLRSWPRGTTWYQAVGSSEHPESFKCARGSRWPGSSDHPLPLRPRSSLRRRSRLAAIRGAMRNPPGGRPVLSSSRGSPRGGVSIPHILWWRSQWGAVGLKFEPEAPARRVRGVWRRCLWFLSERNHQRHCTRTHQAASPSAGS
jgi:hypothetical protein